MLGMHRGKLWTRDWGCRQSKTPVGCGCESLLFSLVKRGHAFLKRINKQKWKDTGLNHCRCKLSCRGSYLLGWGKTMSGRKKGWDPPVSAGHPNLAMAAAEVVLAEPGWCPGCCGCHMCWAAVRKDANNENGWKMIFRGACGSWLPLPLLASSAHVSLEYPSHQRKIWALCKLPILGQDLRADVTRSPLLLLQGLSFYGRKYGVMVTCVGWQNPFSHSLRDLKFFDH